VPLACCWRTLRPDDFHFNAPDPLSLEALPCLRGSAFPFFDSLPSGMAEKEQ
jgi:hypothetical protein